MINTIEPVYSQPFSRTNCSTGSWPPAGHLPAHVIRAARAGTSHSIRCWWGLFGAFRGPL